MQLSYLLKVWEAEGPAGSSCRLWLSARLLHTEASEVAVDMRKSLTHTLTRMRQPPTTTSRTCTAGGEEGVGGGRVGNRVDGSLRRVLGMGYSKDSRKALRGGPWRCAGGSQRAP